MCATSVVAARTIQLIELTEAHWCDLVASAMGSSLTGSHEAIDSLMWNASACKMDCVDIARAIVTAVAASATAIEPDSVHLRRLVRVFVDALVARRSGSAADQGPCIATIACSLLCAPLGGPSPRPSGPSHQYDRAALVFLVALVSASPYVARPVIEHLASEKPEPVYVIAFAAVAAGLFARPVPFACDEDSMTGATAAALSNANGSTWIKALVRANRSLFKSCIAADNGNGSVLNKFVETGGDLGALFDALASVDPLLPNELCVSVTTSLAVSAVRKSNVPAIVYLVQKDLVLSDQSLRPDPDPDYDEDVNPHGARVLLAALEHKSPFLSEEAKVPSVYEVLVELVRLVDARLVDDRISRHVLIHTIRIMEPFIVGACRGTSRVAAMADMRLLSHVCDTLGHTIGELVTTGSRSFLCVVLEKGQFGLACSVIALLSNDGCLFDAMACKDLADTFVRLAPIDMVHELHRQLKAELLVRERDTSACIGHIRAASAALQSQPRHIRDQLVLAEETVCDHQCELRGIWPVIVRRFACWLCDGSSASSPVRTGNVARLWSLLNVGGDAQAVADRVYEFAADRLLATAFEHVGLIGLLVGSKHHTRLSLLRAWSKRVRALCVEGAMRPGGTDGVRVDRLELRDPAKAQAAVTRLVTYVHNNGGFEELSAWSLTGLFSVTFFAEQASVEHAYVIKDTATGRGAAAEYLLLLVELCLATDSFDRDHPDGAVPTPGADDLTMELLGFAIGKLIVEDRTLGRGLAPPILALIAGVQLNATRALFYACVKTLPIDFRHSVAFALTMISCVSDAFTPGDVEYVERALGGAEVTLLNVEAFLQAANDRVLSWHNLGRPVSFLTTGFNAAVLCSGHPTTSRFAVTIMSALGLILTDAAVAPVAADAVILIEDEPVAPLAITASTATLSSLIVGDAHLDPLAIKRHTVYERGFDEHHRVIAWFWEIAESMSQAHLKDLFRFWTSQNAPPSGAHVGDKYVISVLDVASWRVMLPTAATCVYTLSVPDTYQTKEELRDALGVSVANTNTGMHG